MGGDILPHGDCRRWEGWVGEVANGNSNVPGKTFVSQKTVVPHVGQKWKVNTLPLSAVRGHAGVLPAKETCSSRKRAWLLIAPQCDVGTPSSGT